MRPGGSEDDFTLAQIQASRRGSAKLLSWSKAYKSRAMAEGPFRISHDRDPYRPSPTWDPEPGEHERTLCSGASLKSRTTQSQHRSVRRCRLGSRSALQETLITTGSGSTVGGKRETWTSQKDCRCGEAQNVPHRPGHDACRTHFRRSRTRPVHLEGTQGPRMGHMGNNNSRQVRGMSTAWQAATTSNAGVGANRVDA